MTMTNKLFFPITAKLVAYSHAAPNLLFQNSPLLLAAMSPARTPDMKFKWRSPTMKSPRSVPDMRSLWRTPKMNSPARFTLGRQSSRAPAERPLDEFGFMDSGFGGDAVAEMEAGMRLMYMANEGDLEGIRELLGYGVDLNFKDIDERTPLHIAACQGQTAVVEFLLKRGAEVDPQDRWGSTPLADARFYKNEDLIKLLEKYGAKSPTTPMHVHHAQIEYEIDPKELDFTNSLQMPKGTFCVASWRGIQVAVKTMGDYALVDENKIEAFKDELTLLQQIRHPNLVQFLGAVTQSSPMMIITEYLPKGDLRAFLDRKGALKPSVAVKYALEIARGMNYLHQHKPEAIIHHNLEPSNILRDYSGHLKVANFGISKQQKVAKSVKEDRGTAFHEFSWRYMAPEVFRGKEYGINADVFSFALILQEMIEGCSPFSSMLERDVPKAYCAGGRPPFRAPEKKYAYGLKELIEQCWNENPSKRPPFNHIIKSLEDTCYKLDQRNKWKFYHGLFKCFWILRRKLRRDRPCSSSRASISVIR